MRRKVVSFFITLGLAIFMSVNVVSAGAGEDGITSVETEEAVVNTDYLTRSTPEQTTLTVLETKTMAIPYADRIIDHENDPALVDSDAITGVSYVSLYRNDTGLPILIDGARGGDFASRAKYGTIKGVNKASRVCEFSGNGI